MNDDFQRLDYGPILARVREEGAAFGQTMKADINSDRGSGEAADGFPSTIGRYADYVHEWAARKGFWPEPKYVGKEGRQPSFAERMMGAVASIAAAVERDRKDAQPLGRSKSFAECCMLIVTEVVEAYEANEEEELQADKHCPDFLAIEVELADVIVRVLDLAAAHDVRIGEAIVAKMAYNEGREQRHGKAY